LAVLSCQTTISVAVVGKTLIDQIFVPNAFNPNSSIPANRTLKVYGFIIQSMQFMIFNQWGEKVFESTNQSVGWDGTYKGKPSPSGVYIYVLKMSLINGTISEMKGSISLIR
jgi:gliding motility-associated-like protein